MKCIKLIPLSKNGKVNKGRYFAKVDDKDYEALSKFNWYAVVTPKGLVGNSRKIVYAFRSESGHPEYSTGEKRISMHRQIKGFPDRRVYFKDGDGLNCTRKNLTVKKPRYMYESRKFETGSKFRGVSFHPVMGMWRATFMNKSIGIKKQTVLGFAKTQKECAKVYNDFVKKQMRKHKVKLFLNKINY